MTKPLLSICVALALAGLMAVAFADDNQPATDKTKDNQKEQKGGKDEPSVWMRTKLRCSQNIFTALSSGDFDKISENAKRMKRLNQLERWARGRDPNYRTHLKFFRYANNQLIAQAEKENLDGATLAFMQLTASCVNCHRAIRDGGADVIGRTSFDHVLEKDAKYYLDGPQQAKPADGNLKKGTKVWLVREAGSYSLVEAETGVVAYVATDTLRRIAAAVAK